MQTVVSKKELLRILARCQAVADKKSTMPVLGNVLLKVDDGSLHLAATDLFLAVRGRVAAKVEQPGQIALGARDLYERVKMMPDGELSISTTEGAAAAIRSLGAARRYTLHGIPGEEFPSLPQVAADAKAPQLGAAALLKLIVATHFSISTDETRLHLNSALFEWDGNTIRMVTTDGHRLSKMELQVEGEPASFNMLIPLKGVQELRRLCEDALAGEQEAPQLSISQNGPDAFFSLAGFEFSVKLVDAEFPPYEQVIPDSSERAVRAPRQALAEALKAVSLAASDRTGGVKMTLSPSRLRFESEGPETGEGFDEVPVDYQGDEVVVGFNARYFLDVLGAMTDDEVILGISGELDPAVIKPGKESAKGSYLAVVMPMRI